MRPRGPRFNIFPVASGGLTQTMTIQYCIRGVYLPHSPKKRYQLISNSRRRVKSWIRKWRKKHRPASILKVSLSPSPVACKIVSLYMCFKQVESMQYNVWERITPSAPGPSRAGAPLTKDCLVQVFSIDW